VALQATNKDEGAPSCGVLGADETAFTASTGTKHCLMTTIKPPQKRLNITPKKFRRGKRVESNVTKLAKQVSALTHRV
jgi:hypothetical protein